MISSVSTPSALSKSNLLTVTMAGPDTYALAYAQPERYELVRVRIPRASPPSTGDVGISCRRKAVRVAYGQPTTRTAEDDSRTVRVWPAASSTSTRQPAAIGTA